MKNREFFEMTDNELSSKLVSLKQELFNLRFKHAVGQLENPTQLVVCKKNIARVKTIIRQRELKISVAPVAAEKTKRKAAKK